MMVSANVNKLLEETKRLSPDERRQLLDLLSATEAQVPLTDCELDELLIRRGTMSAMPAKPTVQDVARAEAWQPVAIEGKPLSETIIEERR